MREVDEMGTAVENDRVLKFRRSRKARKAASPVGHSNDPEWVEMSEPKSEIGEEELEEVHNISEIDEMDYLDQPPKRMRTNETPKVKNSVKAPQTHSEQSFQCSHKTLTPTEHFCSSLAPHLDQISTASRLMLMGQIQTMLAKAILAENTK